MMKSAMLQRSLLLSRVGLCYPGKTLYVRIWGAQGEVADVAPATHELGCERSRSV